MTLKDLLKLIFPYEKALSQMTGKAGGADRRVESIKNILFNHRSVLHATAAEMDAKDKKIAALEEMNAALNAALGETDKAGRKQKPGPSAQPPGKPDEPPKG